MAQYTKDTYQFTKPNRTVKALFCHCSASDNPAHDNVDTMYDWHVNGNGWSDVGYHIYIQKDGTIEDGRPLEEIPAAQSGYNTNTIAICCGGLETFTVEQANALYTICDQINMAYGKNMFYYGHNQVAAKACPVYDWTIVMNLDTEFKMTTSNIDTSMPPQITVDGDPAEPVPPPLSSQFPYWDVSPFRGHKSDMPVIGNGDKGFSVTLLQAMMSSFEQLQIEVDGIFGPNTERKVRKVQEIFELDVDGIVGKNTWEAVAHLRAVLVGVVATGVRSAVVKILGDPDPNDTQGG